MWEKKTLISFFYQITGAMQGQGDKYYNIISMYAMYVHAYVYTHTYYIYYMHT